MILYGTNSYRIKIGTYGLHSAETEAHFSEAGTGFQYLTSQVSGTGNVLKTVG